MNIIPIKRPRELVYETVKRRIMMNELKPGSVLTELGSCARDRLQPGHDPRGSCCGFRRMAS